MPVSASFTGWDAFLKRVRGRRHHEGNLMALICMAAALSWLIASPRTSEAGQPNVVFILADDLGYGDVGCFGQKRFATPRLDGLASAGMRLTQHYAGSTVCAPSRCALLTGLHTGHCEIRGNLRVDPIGQSPMSADAVTLAECLQSAGYRTGAFGKWGLGPPASTGDPLNQGFDEFFGYNCQRNAHRYYPAYLFDGEQKLELDGKTYSPDLITDRALDFIRRHRSRPFFCFLPITLPHAAMEAPDAAREPFRRQFPQFERKVGKYAGSSTVNPIASFAAMVTRLDGDVGRVVDLLDELGLANDTIVIFTSDNGPHVEGGHDPKFFDSNGPYRGFKRDLYEGGLRVPTIVKWPSQVAAGTESAQVSAGWDWLPTLCALTGASCPEGIDGVSLAPTLTGRGTQDEHEFLYWEFPERGGSQAVRFGPWKAIRLRVSAGPNARLELYHLPSDPEEKQDLAAKEPEVLAMLVAYMDAAHRPSKRFDIYAAP